MVTSNHFIIEMLQIIKTYQAKIKKNETWFSFFLISLFSYLLSYHRQSLVILKPNFKISLIVSTDVLRSYSFSSSDSSS